MSKYISYLLILLLATPALILAAEDKAKKLKPLPINKEIPLDEDYGYLLIKLDIAGNSPTIQYRSVKSKNGQYLQKGEGLKLRGDDEVIALSNTEDGFYYLPMEEGLYQFTTVSVPYFDLPYMLDTTETPSWRFSIVAGQINFIGTLKLAKERDVNTINVKLFNRLATNADELRKLLADDLQQFPLRSGAGLRDDFTLLSDK